jgi:hypothetical protein
VAGFATLLELAFVRITMAIRALCELQPGVPRLSVGSGGMALFADYFTMGTGQRVMSLRVVEVLLVELGPLPARGRVALCAGLPKAALVLILMACGASRSEAHPCVIEVFCVQQPSRCRGNALRIVAGSAGNAGVFSVERKSGLRVIEAFGRRIPMHQREVFSIVVRVAFYAR